MSCRTFVEYQAQDRYNFLCDAAYEIPLQFAANDVVETVCFEVRIEHFTPTPPVYIALCTPFLLFHL